MEKLALINGKIYVEKGVFAQAVLCKNGRIAAVGSDGEILALAGDAKVIDCGGKTVIPGLNDSHLHLIQIGVRMAQVNIKAATSIDDLVRRVREFRQADPELCEKGITSNGWNQDKFTEGEKRTPNRYDLDRIATDIPVVLSRVCGHVVSCNSKALELLGMDKAPGVAEGGTIEVDEQGVPNGIFTENCGDLPYTTVPAMTMEDAKRRFLVAAEYALSHGITSVQSNDVSGSYEQKQQLLDMLQQMYDNGECPLRYRMQMTFNAPADLREFVEKGGYDRPFSDPDRITFGPVKLFKDGSLGGRTATVRREYLDEPGNFGVEIASESEMDAFCALADQYGLQVVTHVIGDKAIEDVTANYERVLREGKNPLRHALVHCQITDRPLLERIVRADIPAMYQPIFLDYDMHAVISRCGEQMASTSYAFKTFTELGGHVSYGTDAPVEDCNPFPNLYSAVTRKDKTGWPEGGFFPAECVTVEEAIDAYTLGSAYNEFREQDKGRIKPDFLADMVVLDTDIFTCDPMAIRDILPVMTIVGGRVVWEK